jgi:hypothetical protein
MSMDVGAYVADDAPRLESVIINHILSRSCYV